MVINLKLTTHWLGDRRGRQDGVMRFNRDADGLWLPDLQNWLWAIGEAAKLCDKRLNEEAIRFATKLLSPTLHRYVRHFRVKGEKRSEIHEAYAPGTIISVPVDLLDCDSKGNPGHSKEEFLHFISVTGDRIGLSPWGSQHGFGRFVLIGTR